MKILFATPEFAPWIKTGGLGDVSGALPAALSALGHDVHVLIPAYDRFATLIDRRAVVDLPAADGWPAARITAAQQPGGVTLLLLECPELYGHGGGPYIDGGGQDHPHNARRFGFLAWVAARLAGPQSPWMAWQPDILHCHDWTVGLAPFYLWLAGQRTGQPVAASVMTVHNLAFQGVFPMADADMLRVPAQFRDIEGVEYWGQLSMLKAGLSFCDAITTVSPTYAREISTEALGMGLHGVLQARASHLHGILNGVDTAIWNPATDTLLPQNYSAASMGGKAVCKAALQREFGLTERADVLLLSLVGRLTPQKGIDLVVEALPWIVDQGAQLVVLGEGDRILQQALTAAAAAHPQQVSINIGFSESQAHRIEAGADAFLMPSRFEPCGLNQMYSQLYGTVPLVHATGGLADSVIDLSAGIDSATGVVMPQATTAALLMGLERLRSAFAERVVWQALQHNGMRSSFGWQDSARAYDALYRNLRPAVPVEKA
ncbi:glycogen synthase GlgA [Xylophilus sp. GOD-11R]|uniref:glycogen synthase GlgA n=1 Tax=Xylophilus sp. GOD-11R TaxID=3089814 RepID=UPI00298BF53F|nr:glycogen synthase GlgA [Xylophilus sp. GOD-11R]WPB55321.1 glycogen synthase GlgA [Xylophilus sp. GOD-11R]